MDLTPLNKLPVYNRSSKKEYHHEKIEFVSKNIKLRFNYNGEVHRFGPFKMELTTHRMLLLPQNMNEGSYNQNMTKTIILLNSNSYKLSLLTLFTERS